ncbi:MAG TPA: type VI secretion system tube protein Hcp [Fimbriimonas sp.]|nr:type VI secretion system tube protein Hcp [Fimbriimonas sp.]
MPIYMKYGDKTNGTSQNTRFPNYFDVTSMTWGVGRPYSHDGSVPGFLAEFFVSLTTAPNSPLFFQNVNESHTGETVIIVVTTAAGPNELIYQRYTLTESLLSSYSTSVDSVSGRPTEVISINAPKVMLEQFVNREDGTHPAPGIVEMDIRI